MGLALYYEWLDKGVLAATGTGIAGTAPVPAEPPASIDFSYAPQFKQLFDLYLTCSSIPARATAQTSVDTAIAAFARGEVAMVQTGSWAYSQIMATPGASVKSSDLAFIPLYFGAPGEDAQGLCVGCEHYYCVNGTASAAGQQAAQDFLAWLYTTSEGESLVNGDLGFVAPFDTFNASSAAEGNPLAREVLRWCGMSDHVAVPWAFSAMPSEAFKQGFGSDLQQYAQGQLDWPSRVEKTVASWAQEAASPTPVTAD
jgi:raffinose/stachyose/melibiose transport system substrate-binding protein